MNNYINQTPNMPMYNGYNNYRLPTYEVIKVNGRGGANAFQMGPNSSILLLDETDNIVWLAQTDGAGYKTVTPFDIVPHKEEQKVDMTSVINRIEALELSINELKEVQNAKSNFRSNSKSKQQPDGKSAV